VFAIAMMALSDEGGAERIAAKAEFKRRAISNVE